MDNQDFNKFVAQHGRDCGGIAALICEYNRTQGKDPFRQYEKLRERPKKIRHKTVKKNIITQTYTISDIRDLIQPWTLERFSNNSRKFKVTNKKKVKIFNWSKPIKLLYTTIKDLEFENFLKEYAK